MRRKHFTFRPSPQLSARIAAHVAHIQHKASEAGVPVPSESAVILDLLERGLAAYAATFGEGGGAESAEKGSSENG